jgi:UDP-N-acetylmuramyl pentapeptide phosphotransferase/UDP-N-acetylglucosamine-1-phosphate transferase
MRTAIALASAAVVLLVAGGVARALARRRSWTWLRTSGGVLVVLAVPAGLAAAPAINDRAGAIAAGALVLAGYGVLRDQLALPRFLTPLVVAGAAVLATTSGLRFALGGVDAIDVAWTVAFLVAVTMCVTALGSADGLVASVGAASAAGIVAVAAFAVQGVAATVPAALLGALCGFLAYNLRPASLYMGNAGGLPTGFLLASCALWAKPSIDRPGSLLVSGLVVGVPIVDGLVVVFGRLRRGHPLTVRVRDHLVHRLAGAGASPARAVAVPVVVQALLSVLAIFVARGVVSPLLAALVAVLLAAVLVGLAMRARLRDGGERRGRRVGLLVFGLIGLAILVSIPAAIAAYSSRDKITAGREAAIAALRAARKGKTDVAAVLFASAERSFQDAYDQLGSPITMPSLVVPVVGSNIDAARSLARIGVDLSRAGRQLADTIDPDALRVVDGRVPLEAVAAAEPQLVEASRVLTSGKRDLDGIDTTFLVADVDEAVRKLGRNLTDAERDASHATDAAQIAHLVLGQEQQRRYLLVVQNPAEIRGTGGLIGNWGILTATNGSVHLEDLQRVQTLNSAGDPATRVLHAPADYVARYQRFDPARTWQNVNITPDFPTAAAVMADVYAQSFPADSIDGVLAVDPAGLAALLQLTGPVRVAGWPTPVNAKNVVNVTLRDAYARFARTPERADFLGDVARVAIDRATSGSLGTPATLGRVLGRSAHAGHIQLWLANPEEQRVAEVLGISGAVPSTATDSLIVSNTNAGGNKLDFYLQRRVDYSVTVTPTDDLRHAFTQGTVTIDLQNNVPLEGVPQIAAGPFEGATDRFVYGQNASFLSVYTPLTFTEARAGTEPVGLEPAEELGRNVYSRYIDVFAGGSANLTIDLAGNVRLVGDGWYELTLMRQPTVRPDSVAVHITAPSGFEIVAARGLDLVDGVAEKTVDLTRTRTFRVKLAHSSSANLWERLRDGS